MFSRLLSLPLLLGAAVGVPYIATNGPNIDGLFGSAKNILPNSLSARDSSRPAALQGPGATLYPIETPLEGFATVSLHEVFNMNVSKEWVYQRWARKSTALSELGLFGVRVPLVTGTQLHDLAGSLTYFFGRDGRVSRISFHGTTGDTTELVRLAAQQYGLRQQSTPIAGEQLFQIRQQNQVFSELRTRPAPVLWASSPHDSFAVDLELQRPGTATPLPSRLPPLPIIKAPPVQQPSAAAQQLASQKQKKRVQAAKAEKKVDPSKKWDAFFPRSRVPNKQINSLDRRSQLW